MKLSDAILNYPWEGVTLVAINPESPGDIFMVKRVVKPDGRIENVILSTEGTAEEVYGDREELSRQDIERMKQENNLDIAHHEMHVAKDQPKEKTNNKNIKKMLDMEHWDWKPLRSLMYGYTF